MSDHRRRRSDRGWRIAFRENWYRDLWLVVVTVFVAWAISIAQDEAGKGVRLAREIEQQRIDSTWDSCRAQDERHDNTIKALNVALGRFERHPIPGFSKKLLQQSVKDNIALIDALAPKQDCLRVVKLVVGPNISAALIVRPNLPPMLRQ